MEPTKQADLKSISLAGLLAGDVDAVNNLVQSCKQNGFFYLDLCDASTCKTLKQADDLVDVGKSVFKLSLEEKEEYSTEKYLPSRLLGYVSFAMTKALKSNPVATNEPAVPLDHLLRRRTAMRAFRYEPILLISGAGGYQGHLRFNFSYGVDRSDWISVDSQQWHLRRGCLVYPSSHQGKSATCGVLHEGRPWIYRLHPLHLIQSS